MLLNREQYANLISDLTGLFHDSFGTAVSQQALQWRYLCNPIKDLLASVWIENNLLAANYSASPCLLRIKGNAYKTGLSVTTMTHPDFRGRGLFPLLANELYAYMHSLGYLMVWGFPNRNSHPIFRDYLGWKDIYTIPMMRLPLASVKGNHRLYNFDDNFDLDYLPPVGSDHLIHIQKDKSYLRWRYKDNPRGPYRNSIVRMGDNVSSFCISKPYLDGLDMVDIQVRDLDEGEYLLRQVISLAVNSGCKYINCWAPEHHFIHLLCWKLGFRPSSTGTHFAFKSFSPDFNGMLENYENWFIQMGDSDVY